MRQRWGSLPLAACDSRFIVGADIQIEVIENGLSLRSARPVRPEAVIRMRPFVVGISGTGQTQGAPAGIHFFGKQKPRAAIIGGELDADCSDSDRLPADFRISSRDIPAAVEGEQLKTRIG